MALTVEFNKVVPENYADIDRDFNDNFDKTKAALLSLDGDIATRAPKADTIAGYGITDAYTRVEVDGIVYLVRGDITALSDALAAMGLDLERVETIAKGASRAIVFATRAALDEWLLDPANVALLRIGDNLYIVDRDTPDYWWDGAQVQELETAKVDLSNVYTKDEVTALLAQKAAVSEVLTKINATPYTPTGDYHPSTKKYVDDAVGAAGGGDMLKAVYDPQNKARDVFAYVDDGVSGVAQAAAAAQSTAATAQSTAAAAQTAATDARAVADLAATKAATAGERAELGITNAAAAKAVADAALPKSGGAMTGNLISNNPAVGTSAVRNIYAGTSDLTAGSSALTTGAMYFVYE